MVSIEIVDNPQKAHQLADVLASVWGDSQAVSADVIIAVAHAGGYASIAQTTLNGEVKTVGGSLGIVGRNDEKLHSHVTGVVSNATNNHVGRELKQHQWAWAKHHGLSAISWTFDPLVRRNAHFNLISLGAKVVAYHQDFYGELSDALNAGDSTDRLVVERQVVGLETAPVGKTTQAQSDEILIATPEDIVAMRQKGTVENQKDSRQWRTDQRKQFETAFGSSHFVRGFTADGSFVLRKENA